MAIIHRVPKEALGAEFQHCGWFCGLCPVYIADIHTGTPLLVERNWIPEWWFAATEQLFGAFCVLASAINPDFVPEFPITITGEYRR